MKNSWKAAKKLQEESGFGVKEDDCTNSVNGRIFQLFANWEAAAAYPVCLEVLNKKCKFFWRLDEIFGTRPNNNPVVTTDTLPQQEPEQEQPESQQEPLSESQPQMEFDPLILGSDDWPESEAERQEPGDHANSSRNSAAPTPTTASAAPTPTTTSAVPTPTTATAAPTRAPSTNATSALASSTRTQSRPRPSASSRRSKGDGELKRLVELNRGDLAEREEKRQKIQADAQIEVARIQAESQERLMEKKLQMKREEGESQMQVNREERELQREMQREERELQREREEKQLQMFQTMMASMIQIVTARSNHTNNDSS